MTHNTSSSSQHNPVIWWIRRDLRLSDNPALRAACDTGRPVLPLYIFDEFDEELGAAPAFRLQLGLQSLSSALSRFGQTLCLRRGSAQKVLAALVQEVGATAIYSSKSYLQNEIQRDQVLDHLPVPVRWHTSRLMFEPWTVETKTGTPFRVYSPFRKAVQHRVVEAPLPSPHAIPPLTHAPVTETLDDWQLSARMKHSADVVKSYVRAGEAAAFERLDTFLSERIARYGADRDRPDMPATSGLSEYLAWGEISPRSVWAAGQRAMAEGRPGAEPFLHQLIWREFAWHLAYHYPHLTQSNWRPEWDRFPWQTEITPAVRAWQQGQTGVDLVDAGMRELWVTGRMHNRVRMVVASYLTKHMTTHWKIGADWFADTLVDWCPANNAMGWQWVAGSGPDAAPYFRIFNPDRQRQTFDPVGAYTNAWIAEGQAHPPKTATDYFLAQRGQWGHSRHDLRPEPIVTLSEGRNRALAAYKLLQNREM